VKTALLVGIAAAVAWCAVLFVGGLVRLATDEVEGTATVPGLVLAAALIVGLVSIGRGVLRAQRTSG